MVQISKMNFHLLCVLGLDVIKASYTMIEHPVKGIGLAMAGPVPQALRGCNQLALRL